MPDGNRIQHVAIVGAGGNSGIYMTNALLDSGKFIVTALTRPDNKSKLPDGIKTATVDYESHDSLVKALTGQDALIITLGGAVDTESRLIHAAADAGVPWILNNDWSPDTEDEDVVKDIFVMAKVPEARRLIAELGKSSFISLSCGFWYEWSLAIPMAFGFDFANKTATFFDDGDTKISTSTWPQVGRAVSALLSLPIQPENGDAEHSLDHFKNKVVYVKSFTISQQDMLESVLRITGDKLEDWTITNETARERYNAAAKEMQQGNRMAYVKLLYVRIFYGDGNGNFEKRRGVANAILDLPEEDLDEATGRAIQRSVDVPFGHS